MQVSDVIEALIPKTPILDDTFLLLPNKSWFQAYYELCLVIGSHYLHNHLSDPGNIR